MHFSKSHVARACKTETSRCKFRPEFTARHVLHNDKKFGSACHSFFDLNHVRMFQLLHDRYSLLDLATHSLLQDVLIVNNLHRDHMVGFRVNSQLHFAKCKFHKCFHGSVSAINHTCGPMIYTFFFYMLDLQIQTYLSTFHMFPRFGWLSCFDMMAAIRYSAELG